MFLDIDDKTLISSKNANSKHLAVVLLLQSANWYGNRDGKKEKNYRRGNADHKNKAVMEARTDSPSKYPLPLLAEEATAVDCGIMHRNMES